MGPQPPSLCPLCSSISVDILTAPGRFKHEDDDMFGSGGGKPIKGCDLCLAFSHERSLWEKRDFHLRLTPQQGTHHRVLGLTYGDKAEAAEPTFLLFTDDTDPAVLAGVRILRKPLLPSPNVYQIAMSWILECASDHQCSPAKTNQEPPGWLIDLSHFSPESQDAKLVDVARPRPRY